MIRFSFFKRTEKIPSQEGMPTIEDVLVDAFNMLYVTANVSVMVLDLLQSESYMEKPRGLQLSH